MHPVLLKTFGGLSKQYYFRNFVFGLVLVAFFVFMLLKGANGIPVNFLIMLAMNALLYPYSRFVYESVVGFVIGNNVFISSALFMLAVKLFMMVVCFFCAIFIAPVGLVYLYFYHTKQAQQEQQEQA